MYHVIRRPGVDVASILSFTVIWHCGIEEAMEEHALLFTERGLGPAGAAVHVAVCTDHLTIQ